MRYLSVCSGIEAASVAWEPLGWEPVAFSEIEPFPSAVLAHHWPNVPNLGDMTRFKEWPDGIGADLLVGGTPCQSFSVAGLRKGLDDPRGNLALVYLAIADRYRPKWLVWENVPGVLSSNGGRDFGSILGGMAELGYGWAYRVLDAQYFGVAQRRRRVFVVGHLGDWRGAAAVLLERESLCGHPPPRREAGKGSAPATQGGTGGCFQNTGHGWWNESQCAQTVRTPEGGGSLEANLVAHALDQAQGQAVAFEPRFYTRGGNCGGAPAEIASAVRSNTNGGDSTPAVAIRTAVPAVAFKTDQEPEAHGDICPTLQQPSPSGGGQPTAVLSAMQVRRLTPRECERLQGFPDDFTLIPYRGKPAKDGPRYKALGNSMAVPVMRWIGERIAEAEVIMTKEA